MISISLREITFYRYTLRNTSVFLTKISSDILLQILPILHNFKLDLLHFQF